MNCRYGYGTNGYLKDAGFYGQVSRSWKVTGAMNSPGYCFLVTMLHNGQVLAVGGLNHTQVPASAEW